MQVSCLLVVLWLVSTAVPEALDDDESGSGEDIDGGSPPIVSPPPVYEMYSAEVHGNLTCESYMSGGLCQNVLPTQLPVWTNLSRASQGEAKDDLDKIFYVLSQAGSSKHCFNRAIEILCHFTFPYCDPAYREPIYQPICQHDCRLMRDFICPVEWMQMRSLEGLIDFGAVDSFDCEILAPSNGGEAPMCISALDGGPIPPYLLSGPNCYTGSGRGYNGTVNVTESGHTCQVWTRPYPHQHYLFPYYYPELAGDHNYCRNPGSKGERPWCFTTNRARRWEYCDIDECSIAEPVCESYSGNLCRIYGTIGMEPVYINKSIASQQILESQLEKVVTALANDDFQDCRDILLELLCRVNFPTCDASKATPTPRRVCRDYCTRVKDTCRNFYEYFTNFMSVSGITNLVIPQCNERDSDLVNAGESPECSMPIPEFLGSDPSCYDAIDNGIGYEGVANETVSGKACQPWDSQLPHQHPFNSLFRRHLEGHNYCRNVDGRGLMPWCYTMDSSQRWEYCAIQECTTTPSQTESVLPESFTWIMIGVGVAVFLIILIIFVLVLICIIRCKTNSKTLVLDMNGDKVEMCEFRKANDYSSPMPTKPLIDDEELSEHLNGATLPFIQRDQLVYVCDLGEGHFGKVLKAEGINIIPGYERSMVAVKVLKEGTSTSAKKEFFREARLMNEYNHRNIVHLLGVCIKEEPLCMVFEYMEMGDLHSFLRQNAPDHTFSFPQSGPNTIPGGLRLKQMILMSTDIAAGLDYLSTNHYIHRDLATRNCLVDSKLCVKISDFGMSQDIYVCDYFKLGDSEMLPIRWMPPEAIMYSTFSTESDVWSFGVVLWEIFSFGMQPYYGMGNEQVVQYVKECKVLTQPERCPQEIYDLMLDCWVINPKERPKACEIHQGLKTWTPELSAQVKVETKSHPDYQNMSVILQWAAAGQNYSVAEDSEDGGALIGSPNYQNHSTICNGFTEDESKPPETNGQFEPYDKLAPKNN